ncbi:MAG: 1-deoxy-D-xylulose-5-phosphate synthase [Oscillospiraceae bacterium]|nr:1-deoxy-D-xylulose-5-phosphate synthase [Oscillospiraceae bacterium]
MSLLESIKSPADIKILSFPQLEKLAEEIRLFLIDTTSRNGGHLASNLGVVDITLALHYCFNCPEDDIVFDVGHQCYTHKIITGRFEELKRLRKRGGAAGFPKPAESGSDPFYVGHSSTSISSALGLAEAKALKGDGSHVVAIIGDGAFSGGMAYEAINNLKPSLKNLIVVLNDNEMSISKSVGSLARYLLELRTSAGYLSNKKRVQDFLEKRHVIGPFIIDTILKSKSALRRAIYNGTLFEELGFNYIGPVNGHDIGELCSIFENVKSMNSPILVHAITVKGKGFIPAEVNPGAYHGVGKFDLDAGNPDISLADSYSNCFGRRLVQLAESDEKICAITAAMKYGTGLQYFYKKYPDRFFDVGIAEQHAVTFAAGLAKGGMKPVFSVYSTFLQRAFDQLYQDVMLGSEDVLLAIDRAGLVGDDGETHQGLLDVAMLGEIGGFTLCSPANYAELEYWLEELLKTKGPRALRYPRGHESERLKAFGCSKNTFDLIKNSKPCKNLIITYGRELEQALAACDILEADKESADILKLNRLLPVDAGALFEAAKYENILFAEEGVRVGGLAETFLLRLSALGFKGKYTIIAAESPAVSCGSIEEQLRDLALDADSLAIAVKAAAK